MTRRKREIIGLRNERDFPHLVELPLPPEGFRSIFLEIDSFHRERRIPVRRGRSRHEVKPLATEAIAECIRSGGVREAESSTGEVQATRLKTRTGERAGVNGRLARFRTIQVCAKDRPSPLC